MTQESRSDGHDERAGEGELDRERFHQQKATRRQLFTEAGKWAAGLVAVAAPGAIGLTAKDAFASHGASVEEVLNFALTLEYLEAEFYTIGVDSGVLESSDADARAMAIFTEVRDHEQAHVALLESALGVTDGQNKPEFDFTAGGQFDPFNDYATFLLLAQGFEDTGVRAYKGQAHALIDDDEVLTTALRIHSVEGRHAAVVRRLRGLQGWIPLAQPGAPAAIQPVYQGEDQTTQLGVDLAQVLEFDTETITEAFDEPLSMDAVLQIASPFIVSAN